MSLKKSLEKVALEKKKLAQQEIEESQPDDAIIGVYLWRSFFVLALLLAIGVGLAYWLNRAPPPPIAAAAPKLAITAKARSVVEPPKTPFVNITEKSGIDFVHFNGAEGEKLLPETMGGGVALIDYDRDHDQDILFISGSPWPWAKEKPDTKIVSRLYQNDGKANFRDVTDEAGLQLADYGMGVAVGDYNNDGWPDLFVTAVGGNRLLKNDGGKFRDVSVTAGVVGDPTQWSSSCGFFDYDRDGFLDLFVCDYIEWNREIDTAQKFTIDGSTRAYGPPLSFHGAFLKLYHNERDGTFTDASDSSGIKIKNRNTGVPVAKALGLTFCDLDRDGFLDVLVANDTTPNMAFKNLGNGTFKEMGSDAGVAFDMNGTARGAMGIDTGDFRNDGTTGIVIGNFANEMTSLYVSSRVDPMLYVDEAIATGLGPSTRTELKFAVLFADYDLDGRLDLVAANGHLEQDINKVQASQQYRQSPHLYWNAGSQSASEFIKVSDDKIGDDFPEPIVGRGAAVGDLDGDGDVDIVLVSNGEHPRVLINNQSLGNHWIRFSLESEVDNRSAIGALVELATGSGIQTRCVVNTRGYLSQSELPLTFGLGKNDKVDRVLITWPDGTKQTIENPEIDKTHFIVRKRESGASQGNP